MGGGLQRAVAASKGHAFAMRYVNGTEVCIRCERTLPSCARRKTRCDKGADKCEQACAHGQPCSCDAPQANKDETHRETPLRRYAVSDEPSGNDSPRSVKDHRPGCLAYGKPYANGCDCGAARINKGGERQ